MKMKLTFIVVLFLLLGGICSADENDKLSQVIRVQADNITVIDSSRRSEILQAVNNNLGKEIVIKPRKNFKESVSHLYGLARRGRMLHSGRFNLNSTIRSVRKKWGKPKGNYKAKNQRMVLYKGRSVAFKCVGTSGKIRDMSCHSFFGTPYLPSMLEFKKELGKPYVEYNSLQIIEGSKKRGIDIAERLKSRGLVKKTTNIKGAILSDELSFNIIVYRAGKYFFYMTECRLRKDTKFYRSVGVRVDADVLGDPWII